MKAWHWSVALPVVVLTGCNSSSGDNPPPPTDSLISISITSKPTEMLIGETMTLGAQATWSSGTTEDITQSATWSVTPMDAAKVEGTTLTAQKASDAATLTLNYQTFSDTATFSIRIEDEDVELTELELSSFEPTMVVGETQQLSLIAKYSDDSQRDVTALAQWQSQDEAVLQAGAGTLTAIGPGQAQINYSFESLSDSVYVDVIDVLPELTEIEIQPHENEVIDGYSLTLTAIAHYSDESFEDISEDIEWQSDNTNIASFVGNELKTHAEGDVVVSISYEGEKDTSSITVTPAIPTEIVPNIQSGNRLEILQGESISRQVSVTLSNGQKEQYDDAQVMFSQTEMDEQNYYRFSVSDDAVRALRSGTAGFYINKLSEELRHRFDQLGIEYNEDTANFTIEVTHNPNLYQWNKIQYPYPEGASFIESFTQDNKIYYVWDITASNGVLGGVAITVFDGENMSEPMMLMEGVKSSDNTVMLNGGGNGYYLHTVQYANREEVTMIFDLNDLDNAHEVDLSGFAHRNWLSFQNEHALAFNSQGQLIVAHRTVENSNNVISFHRYDPATQTWDNSLLQVVANRVGQQLKHPDHMLIINAQTPRVAPSFHFVHIDTLEITHEVGLQYPQNGVSEHCFSTAVFGLSLTDDIENFAVQCFGSEGTQSGALQRLLWLSADQAPLAYTKERGATMSSYSSTERPIVAHISDKVVGAYGTVTNGDGSKNIHIDMAVDHFSDLDTHEFDMTDLGVNVHYTYTGKPGLHGNLAVDSSHLVLNNPHVPDETIMMHFDAVSVWSESEQKWFTDEEMFGTRYLGRFGSYGDGYMFMIDGQWHFSRGVRDINTKINNIEMTVLQMRNPEASH